MIGDGAMTGGMAFEGLNNLGHSGCPVVIVLNDNGRSYAPTVSKLGESLARLRINPHYLRQQNRAERLIRELPIVGHQMERALDAVKAGVREMWEPMTFFEHLGVRYTGPFDGHDIAGVERALRNAAHLGEPVVVHVLTEKGRGYAPAENDPVKRMHDTSALKEGSYTEAFAETLIKIAERRPEVVALTAAMPDSTGLLQFAERFPDRCFDVGIAEQHAVTAAAGMAMGGLRPVVAVYSTFLTRAIDQVNLDVGLLRQPVVFALDRAGITGDDGASHHGVLDMVLLTKIPGMTLMAPSSYQELQVMLEDALEINSGPIAIRWSKTAAPHVEESEIGSGLRGRKVREAMGASVCLLAVGKMLAAATEAAEILAERGVEATVWDVRIVTPPDEEMLQDALAHPMVITIEDGLKDGGAGEHIARKMQDVFRSHGETSPEAAFPEVKILGVPATYIPQSSADNILSNLGLDAQGIAQAVKDLADS